MKKYILLLIVVFAFMSCKELDGVIGSLQNSANPTDQEVSSGLIESLVVGMTKATSTVSQLDGFYKNPLISIPFPAEAEKIKNTLIKVGASKLVDQTTMSLNRAAEKASGEAKEVLLVAIQQMTFTDAMKILFGPQNAATTYLKETTSSTLLSRFQPIIGQSLSSVHATQYWSDVMSKYNKYNVMGVFGKPVNTDLNQYVATKALDGLFTLVEKEEGNIRKNPVERSTALLKKVFGYADAKSK